MTLRKTFERLGLALHELEFAARELAVHIADQSAADAVVVERLEDAAQDLLGCLAEARAGIALSLRAGEPSARFEPEPSALAACHALVLDATRTLDGLLAYDSVNDLLELGERRGGSWRSWAREVNDALGRCRGGLDDVHRSLLECWQDVAERAAAGAVSVQATNIGQQVTVPSEPVYEEVP